MKGLIQKFILITIGITAGVVLSESFLLLRRGSAHEAFKSKGWNYYHQIYEPIATPFLQKKNIDRKQQYFFARKHYSQREPFNAVKSKNELRIFIIGESVAEGFGCWLQNNKEAFLSRFPDRKITIINAGGGAYNSAHILSIAKEIVRHEPDMVFVLMGNNIYYGSKNKGNIDIRTWELLRSPPLIKRLYLNSWVCRNVIDWIYSQGMEGHYSNREFRRDYEDLAEIFTRKKIPFVVFSLPANYADFPPEAKPYFDIGSPEYVVPLALIGSGHYKEAYDMINSDSDALLWFLKGNALRELKRYPEARQAYLKSLELAPSNRTTPEVNKIIREIANKYGAFSVELDVLFEDISGTGLLGNNLFLDHCHWDDIYDQLIIDELVRKINRVEVAGISPVPEANLPLRTSAKKLKYKVFKHQKQSDSAFLANSINSAINGQFFKAIYFFRRVIRNNYQEALKILVANPDQYIYIFEENRWIENNKDLLASGWPYILASAGEALRREGYLNEALEFLDASLKRNPEIAQAYLFRMLIHINMGNRDKTMADLRKVEDAGGHDLPVEKIAELIF